jgi:hypothetical protein
MRVAIAAVRALMSRCFGMLLGSLFSTVADDADGADAKATSHRHQP